MAEGNHPPQPGVLTEWRDEDGRLIAVSGSVLSPELAKLGDELAAADDAIPTQHTDAPFDWFD